jgi:hypothetical protein
MNINTAAIGETLRTRLNLAIPGGLLGNVVRSPAASLLFRPWFDRAALPALVRWILPASRLWATAEACDYESARFLEALPDLTRAGFAARHVDAALSEAQAARARVLETEAQWQALFFAGRTATPDELAVADIARRRAGQAFTLTRMRFIYPARRAGVEPVVWRVESEAAMHARYGQYLYDPDAAFQPPDPLPTVVESARRPGLLGTESILRFAAPNAEMGEAYARVFTPAGVANPPTLIHCHGVAMEAEQIDPELDYMLGLVEQGIRVVRVTAPWHGPRRNHGEWSGERFFSTAPIGSIALLAAQIRELAVLVAWSRATSTAKVAIGGISLGALTTQVAAVRMAKWPEQCRPDALMLVGTSDRLDRVAFQGALTQGMGMPQALEAGGWTEERLYAWNALTDPVGTPAIDPRRIVVALGTEDVVTPFDGGVELMRRWRVPEENQFHRKQGHFSLALGLFPDNAPLRRLAEILNGHG